MGANQIIIPEPIKVRAEARSRAQARLDNLTKPLGSLGELENIITQLAAVQGRMVPEIIQPHFLVWAADHGVATAHPISRYNQEVTEEMTVNIAMGTSVSAVLARAYQIPVRIIDVGVTRSVRHPSVIVRKVAQGTSDFTERPAMNMQQFQHALEVGGEEASRAIEEGADCLILGEMGIGNTTSASALTAWLLNEPVEQLVGLGTGIDRSQQAHKTALIEAVLDRWREASSRSKEDSHVAGFAYLGGFELVAMAGAMLSAAALGVPILLDGLMTGVAALWASRIAPDLLPYLIAGHLSPEPAHQRILDELGLKPILSLGMRVGEGVGALSAWPVLQGALRVMAETATFADARVSNPHSESSAAVALLEDKEETVPVANGFTSAERRAVYKAIVARRDIRVFLPNALPTDAVERILQAGHHGPSVGYMQPWNFIVIEDKDILRRLQTVVERERVRAGNPYPDAKRDYYLRLKVEGLVEAPMTICVTNDPTRGGPHVLGRNTIPETDLMSTSCAIQNMWLAARAEGIGMGWVSIYQKDDVREILSIPPHVEPAALLTLGYTPHFPDIPLLERVGWGERLDLGSLVFQDKWGNTKEGLV